MEGSSVIFISVDSILVLQWPVFLVNDQNAIFDTVLNREDQTYSTGVIMAESTFSVILCVRSRSMSESWRLVSTSSLVHWCRVRAWCVRGEAVGVSHSLAVESMMVWLTRREGIFPDEHYSHQDLIFDHQLKMEIITDKKCSPLVDFRKRWVQVASLVRVNRANLDFLF